MQRRLAVAIRVVATPAQVSSVRDGGKFVPGVAKGLCGVASGVVVGVDCGRAAPGYVGVDLASLR